MSDPFIKFILNEKSQWLQEKHPNAFLLLVTIARRARRIPGLPDGLKVGECFIGNYLQSGVDSEKKYRTAKDRLEAMRIIEIVETCRNRKKGATGTTTQGTKVKLLENDVWDINACLENDSMATERATEGRPRGDRGATKEERIRKNKKEEESVASATTTLIFIKPNVGFTEEEYRKLQETYPAEQLAGMIQKLDEWIPKATKRKIPANTSRYSYFKSNSWLIDAWHETQAKASYSSNITPLSQDSSIYAPEMDSELQEILKNRKTQQA